MNPHILKIVPLALLLALLHTTAWAQMPKEAATGNPAADDAAHVKAKTQWIQDHPEEYRKMGGSPEAVVGNGTAPESTPKPAALAPFAAHTRYLLAEVVAVPSGFGTPNTAELEGETAGLKREFPEHSTELQLGANGSIRIFVPGKTDVRGIEKRNGNQVEWVFDNDSCAGCGKTLHLTLSPGSGNTLQYLMQSEDNEATMAYKFSFIPTLTH